MRSLIIVFALRIINFTPLAIKKRLEKILISLRECAGWSESSLDAHIRSYVFWRCGSDETHGNISLANSREWTRLQFLLRSKSIAPTPILEHTCMANKRTSTENQNKTTILLYLCQLKFLFGERRAPPNNKIRLVEIIYLPYIRDLYCITLYNQSAKGTEKLMKILSQRESANF